MMKLLIIALLIVDIIIVFLFVLFMRRFVRKEYSDDSIDQMNELLHPLITEAKSVSYRLEGQIKEKQSIVNSLTDALDQRIFKASKMLEKPNVSHPEPVAKSNRLKPRKSKNFKEFQDDVVNIANQGFSAAQIASQLAVPQKEVDLILSLKRNIEQVRNISEDMEKNDSFQKLNFPTTTQKEQKSPLIKDILQKKSKNSSKFPSGPPARKNPIAFNNVPNKDAINADEVLKLSKRGVQAEAIAKKMGVSKGEVDLVLGLKKKFQNIERNYNNLNAYK